MIIFAELSSKSGFPGATNPGNPDNPKILPSDNHLPNLILPETQPDSRATINNILVHAPHSLLHPPAAANTYLHIPKILLQSLNRVIDPVEPLGHLEPGVVYVGQHVCLQGTQQELGDVLLELVHFLGELEVAVDVPAAGGEDLVGELDAGAENLRETVELRLALRRKLDAGVLDFLDGGEEVLDVADELVGAAAAE